MPRGVKRSRAAAAATAAAAVVDPIDDCTAATDDDSAAATANTDYAAAGLAPPASPFTLPAPVGADIPAPLSPPVPTPTPSKKKSRPLPASPSFKPASLEQLRAKALRIQQQLAELYPNPPIPLRHGSAFQLLVAVMLSAQSTDAKVNTVTPELFSRGPDAAAMAALEVAEIERIIRVLGLAPTKARNVQRMSQLLVEQYGGQVPDSFQALEGLPGVGHKTASVVMSQAFGRAAFPVDTHIHRLAQRWGLSNGKSVEQTEQDLKSLLPEQTWRDVHLQMIYFGREHCPAQRHEPRNCPICSWAATGARGGSARDGDAPDADGIAAAAAAAAAEAPAARRGGRGGARGRNATAESSVAGADGGSGEADAPHTGTGQGTGEGTDAAAEAAGLLGRFRTRGSRRGPTGEKGSPAGKQAAPGAAAADGSGVPTDALAAGTRRVEGVGAAVGGGPFAAFRAGKAGGGHAEGGGGAHVMRKRSPVRADRAEGAGEEGAVGTQVARPRTRAATRNGL